MSHHQPEEFQEPQGEPPKIQEPPLSPIKEEKVEAPPRVEVLYQEKIGEKPNEKEFQNEPKMREVGKKKIEEPVSPVLPVQKQIPAVQDTILEKPAITHVV